jgi:hypothetical protein
MNEREFIVWMLSIVGVYVLYVMCSLMSSM